jgi:hypothetical protein
MLLTNQKTINYENLLQNGANYLSVLRVQRYVGF